MCVLLFLITDSPSFISSLGCVHRGLCDKCNTRPTQYYIIIYCVGLGVRASKSFWIWLLHCIAPCAYTSTAVSGHRNDIETSFIRLPRGGFSSHTSPVFDVDLPYFLCLPFTTTNPIPGTPTDLLVKQS